MAKILFAWELGEGMGHLVPMRPVLEALVHNGHELQVAAVDLRSAQSALGDIATTLVQAPAITDRSYPLHRPAEGVAELLYMNGFYDADCLQGRHHAWCQLAALLTPDLIIVDHSPGALLMARALSIPTIHTGTGFSLPPERLPISFPGFKDEDNLSKEAALLTSFNRLIEASGGTPLVMLADLYNRVAKKFLLTFEEIDHLGPRTGVSYLGANMPSNGETPVWSGDGPKVFAYLKPFPAIEAFFEAVKALNLSLLMVPDRVPPDILRRHEGGNLRFSHQRHNMRALMEQSDFLIFNGNHGTAAAGLLGGVPMFAFPLHQEHEGCARRLVQSGIGDAMFQSKPDKLKGMLEALIHNNAQRALCEEKARQYQNFDYRNSIASMVADTEEVLG
ncbi:MAG: hypothetical protein CVV10_01670 [Gammaproteobacteria bacterium HGW-Gammaproteobacteria-14]|nr:MAG: hypothetical protein CVV10_01670 [Gammaproteobacteria bacterium HGW-Gammaproteobacteria-14]